MLHICVCMKRSLGPLSKTNSPLESAVHRDRSLMACLTLRVLGASVLQMSSDTLIGWRALLAAWSRQRWTRLTWRNHSLAMRPTDEGVQVSASDGLGVSLRDVIPPWYRHRTCVSAPIPIPPSFSCPLCPHTFYMFLSMYALSRKNLLSILWRFFSPLIGQELPAGQASTNTSMIYKELG